MQRDLTEIEELAADMRRAHAEPRVKPAVQTMGPQKPKAQ
jgi:hypothetical protein